MLIPYWILGIAYIVALLAYFFFGLFNVYHMVRFGFFDYVGKVNTFLFFGVSFAIIFSTMLILKNVPWTQSFPVLQSTDTMFELPDFLQTQ